MNKMRPYLIIASLLALSVVLVACSPQESTGGGPRDSFIGGSDGITMQYEKDSPPGEVTDDGFFPFWTIVRVENEGEYFVSANDIHLTLEGFLATDFGVVEGDLIDIHPTEDFDPQTRDPEGNVNRGTITFVTIPDEDKPLVARKFAGNVEFPFRTTACYKYGTRATGELCILKDLLNEQKNELCDPNGGQTSDSSGSPVSVGNFRQSVIGKDRISFSFDISHSGAGTLYKVKDGVPPAHCPRDAGEIRSNRDVVWARVDAQGLSGLDCKSIGTGGNEGFVRLIDGSRTITCTIDLRNQHNSDSKAIVDINVEFNYEDFIETDVLVKHLLE